MHLTWAICNREGREWGWLWDREGGEVSVGLNTARNAVVSTSLEERPAEWIHPSKSRCKVFCHPEAHDPGAGGYLLHNGLILNPRSVGDRVEIPSVDQSCRLLAGNPSILPTTAEQADPALRTSLWTPVELKDSELMWELIDRTDRRQRQLNLEDPDSPNPVPSCGIIQGNLADSFKVRSTRIGDGKTTWDALTGIATRDHSPDFELEPLDREDGVHAQLNTYYPRQGSDRRDDVILEYGVNVPGNFDYEPSGIDLCNRFVAYGEAFAGGIAPVYVAENRESMGRYGVWQREEQFSTQDIDKLADIAHDWVALHAFQINYVDVIPAVEIGGTAKGFDRDAQGNLVELDDEFMVPPRFGPRVGLGFDYWIGDTITVRAKDQFQFHVDKDQPGPDTDLYVRVTDARFQEVDAAGNVAVALTLAPVVSAAHVGGYATRVRTEDY